LQDLEADSGFLRRNAGEIQLFVKVETIATQIQISTLYRRRNHTAYC